VEGDAVGQGGDAFGVAGLTVLFFQWWNKDVTLLRLGRGLEALCVAIQACRKFRHRIAFAE